MNITTSVVTTLAITTVGRWADNKPVDVKVIAGGAVFVVGLTLISQADEPLAEKFALAVLMLALFRYAPDIMYKMGLIKTLPPPWSRAGRDPIHGMSGIGGIR
jgi:hypothetical protein